jgi:small-conductance mechanosensitive channel
MQEALDNLNHIFREEHPLIWPLILLFSGVATFLLKTVLNAISSRLKRLADQTSFHWDDILYHLLSRIRKAFIFAWTLYLLVQSFQSSQKGHKFLLTFVVIVSVYQVGLWGLYLIENWKERFLEKRMATDTSSVAVLSLLYAGIKTAFIITIVLLGLSNLGIDIGALIAGLGVGGIAVALAAQNILGDLLASLSIVLDRPFVIGDFITVGNDMGTVEKIGIKTTRVRSLSGEELIFSNKDLLENRVHNFKRMRERRVVQNFSVIYSTPATLLEQIPSWTREVIQQHSQLRFERCHFFKYGASALEYETVFWVTDPDYNLFMDLQQKVLIELLQRFERVNVKLGCQALFLGGKRQETGPGT